MTLDEFEAVLITGNASREAAFLKDLQQNIKFANANLNAEFTLSASVGISAVPAYDDLMECMNNADKLMYKDKKNKLTRSGSTD